MIAQATLQPGDRIVFGWGGGGKVEMGESLDPRKKGGVPDSLHFRVLPFDFTPPAAAGAERAAAGVAEGAAAAAGVVQPAEEEEEEEEGETVFDLLVAGTDCVVLGALEPPAGQDKKRPRGVSIVAWAKLKKDTWVRPRRRAVVSAHEVDRTLDTVQLELDVQADEKPAKRTVLVEQPDGTRAHASIVNFEHSSGAGGGDMTYRVRYSPTVTILGVAASKAKTSQDLSGKLSRGQLVRIGPDCVPAAQVELSDVTPFALNMREWGRDSGRALPVWSMSCGCRALPLVEELLNADKAQRGELDQDINEQGFQAIHRIIRGEDLSELSNCAFCLSVLEKPIVTMCCHMFCKECMMGCFKDAHTREDHSARCPICRRVVTLSQVVEIKHGEEARAAFKPQAAALKEAITASEQGTGMLTTFRMKLQPVFCRSSLSTLDTGSGREISAICHGTGVDMVFTP